jgi:Ca2+-transporting ATPase
VPTEGCRIAGEPQGLPAAEAARRLSVDGLNTLPDPERRGALRIVAEVLREPMFALLLCGGLVYLALGDPKEALMLLAFAVFSVGTTVVQELRSEKVLEALRDLTSPRALVIRDGEPVRIPGAEVVSGDLLAVAEGDRVPADATLLRGAELQADESLLTGESVPVDKHPASAAETSAASTLYSGTVVVRGEGLAEVTATGPRTEIGKIGQSLRGLGRETPRLSHEIRRLVRAVAVLAFVASATVVVVTGLVRGSWLKGLLGGVALGMSLIPQEFPMVLAIFMVMGAWRISRSRVLTRRAEAIETLGAATVLCTDKTGTLTQNHMTLVAVWRDGRAFDLRPGAPLPGEVVDLVRTGALASSARAFDPMEKAFHAAVASWRPDVDGLALARVWGLRPDRPVVAQAWTASEGKGLVAMKGAPETVVRLCRLDAAPASQALAAAAAFASRGMRVLGVARGVYDRNMVGQEPEARELQFLGLVGLADPLRPDVPDAVRECQDAGVRVLMVTGDHPSTGRAIAQQAGIADGETLAGSELDRLSDEALARRIEKVSVFARVRPEQKLRIVQALKRAGEVVGMTGDGVNDAPALKAADIGIAMGGRGTDVAREAASLVLLDDDFGSIVRAIRLGRRIYDNLQKAMSFIVAVHAPLVIMSLLPLLLGFPVFLAPVHIAFIEMIIDPACSLVFEAEREEGDLMRRPPRSPDQPLFSRAKIAWAASQGALAAAVTAGVYLVCVLRGMGEAEVRTTAFLTLVGLDIGLILVNRTAVASALQALGRPNPWLWPIVGAAVVVLATAMFEPKVGALFEFGRTRPSDVALGLGGILLGFGLLEALQHVRLAVARRRAPCVTSSAAPPPRSRR